MPRLSHRFVFALATLVALLSQTSARAQYGPILTGAGPVNRAMGGTAVGLPVDPLGTLFWNPAGIAAFDKSQLEFGVETLMPNSRMSSTIPANGFGPGIPGIRLSGSERSESGAFPLPNIGLIHRPDDGPFTFGLGILSVGGFGLNYQGSTANPLLGPRPPAGVGFGPLYSQYMVMQIAPTVAYRVTDRLSVGFAPILDMAHLEVNPGVFAPVNDANGDGFTTYPSAVDTRYNFGGGFQAGIYWQGPDGWNLGATFKSPQWFEPFRYHTADELGNAQVAKFRLNVPLMTSIGVSYTGFERAVIGVDVHYMNFRDTQGYNNVGFGPGGALLGLGFRDVFGVTCGGQYWVTDKLAMQLGYSYHNNPIPDANTFFNVASPLNIQHIASTGFSYKVSEKLKLSMSYVHMFGGSNTGPIYSPAGPVPGTSVTSVSSADSIIFGATVAY